MALDDDSARRRVSPDAARSVDLMPSEWSFDLTDEQRTLIAASARVLKSCASCGSSCISRCACIRTTVTPPPVSACCG
jgi:hypothetical protein